MTSSEDDHVAAQRNLDFGLVQRLDAVNRLVTAFAPPADRPETARS